MANTKLNYKNKYPITKEEEIYLKELGFDDSDISTIEIDLKNIYK